MAAVRKKPIANSKQIADKAQKAGRTFKSAAVNVQKRAAGYGQKIASFFTGLPQWFQSRPVAIKEWRAADRKKKKYRSFKLQKRIKPEPRYIPPAWLLLKHSLQFLWQKKRVFFAILLIHTAVYFVLVRPPQTTDFSVIQDSVRAALGDEGSAATTFSTLGAVVSLSGSSQTNTAAASVLVLVMSLVYIWAIRQLHAGEAIKARDAYYQGLTPTVPVLLILVLISIQLLPFALAGFVYATARSGGLFASGIEDLSFFIVAVLVGLLSLYWMTSTVISAYIVTLPGMYPGQALRAARKLVQFQRFAVFKRIISLPLVLGAAYLLLVLLLIRLLPSQVFILIELLQLLVLPFIHTYFYKLYRALI